VVEGHVKGMGRVLIVSDEPQTHQVLAASLDPDKHTVSHVSRVEEARAAIRNQSFDAILASQKMPDGDDLRVLSVAREADPQVAVVVLAAPDALELSLISLRAGAFDLLVQPFMPEIARATVQRAREHTALLRENSQLRAELDRLKGSAKGSAEVARASQGAGNGNHHKFEIDWIEALPPSFNLRGLLATVEKSLIEKTLQSTGGAQAEAARRLGLSRSDLSYKLLKYELRKESAPS
jgi:DNA-binding NtrC family response regulator